VKSIRNIIALFILTIGVVATLVYAADSLQTSGVLILSPGPNRGVTIAKPVRVSSLTDLAGTGKPAGILPLGGLIPIMPNTNAGAWQPPATGVIKDGFMRANGHVITAQNVTDGSLIPAGTALPDMVTKHIKGGAISSSGGGSNTVTLATNQIPTMTLGSVATGTASANHSHGFTHGHTTGDVDTNHYHSDYGHAHSATTSGGAQAGFTTHTHTGTTAADGEHVHAVTNYSNEPLGTWWNSNSTVVPRLFAPDAIWSPGYGDLWTATNGTQNFHPSAGLDARTGGAHGLSVSNGSPTTVDTADAANTHTHLFNSYTGASGDISTNHYHRVTATVGTASPAALNIEPAYVETVWVIRVM